ncbi:MAG TPA: hypothetical protein VLI21_10175, partial [Casimicrobiaceae bacterium]|nr:hypothetical protein [Casimicrobiaceae bacterium]
MQEPLAVVGPVTMIAIDPDDFGVRRFGDEVIAAKIVAIPPSRLDSLRAVAKDPWLRFEDSAKRLRFVRASKRTL